MNLKKVYKLQEDVVVVPHKETGNTNLIKVNEDNFYFKVSLVAAEFILELNGKQTLEEIFSKILNTYDEAHHSEIKQKGIELLEQLIAQNLIDEA